MCYKASSTNSVISFLTGNEDLLQQYFKSNGTSEEVSYSGLLIKLRLSGTTAEGVDLESCSVNRKDVTSWIKKKYKRYIQEDKDVQGIKRKCAIQGI